VLDRSVDPEKLGVLATDPQDEGLGVEENLEVVVRDPASERLELERPSRPDARRDRFGLHSPILDWSRMAARALAFDFNGTLSDDEPVLFAILSELFAELGRPLSSEEYLEHFVGLSDPEIVRVWLGEDHPELEAVLAKRVARYTATVADGSTVRPEVREAVLYAAERVPVAVVSGAHRAEVEPVLAAAGLTEAVAVVVTAEDVRRGKPDPESYVKALALLDRGLQAEDVTVFEDTEAGVAAATAAGMRCVAVLGTLAPERLALADELAPALNLAAVRRALGENPAR